MIYSRKTTGEYVTPSTQNIQCGEGDTKQSIVTTCDRYHYVEYILVQWELTHFILVGN